MYLYLIPKCRFGLNPGLHSTYHVPYRLCGTQVNYSLVQLSGVQPADNEEEQWWPSSCLYGDCLPSDQTQSNSTLAPPSGLATNQDFWSWKNK